jgi:hypothetical protein
MKVYTDKDNKLYMAAVAYIDAANEKVVTYAMSEVKTFQLKLTIAEWNALPYHYFKDDGEAPRPERKWPYDPMAAGPIVPG